MQIIESIPIGIVLAMIGVALGLGAGAFWLIGYLERRFK
jgi:SNF family Na+-dependent transporter